MKKAVSITVMSLALGLTQTVQASGIPTADVVLNGTAFLQLQQLLQSVRTMQQQYQQLQQTYNSMNGSRGLGTILNNPALKSMLPPEWHSVYDSVKGGGFGGISGPVQSIRDAERLAGAIGDAQRQIVDRERNAAVTDKALGLRGYESAVQRLTQIEGLMHAVNGTTDQKGAQEIVARIAAEQAAIQNEQQKLQLMTMLQTAERNLIEEQKRELNGRLLNPANGEMPGIR